jgi:hypothetical protein
MKCKNDANYYFALNAILKLMLHNSITPKE